VHGTAGYERQAMEILGTAPEADFQWTTDRRVVLGIFVADCSAIFLVGKTRATKLPVFVAIHAGWRGTAAGILDRAIEESSLVLDESQAWISPSISESHFEVGQDVRRAFPSEAEGFFRESFRPEHFYFDLKGFQKQYLQQRGVQVWSHPLCNFAQPDFFSYRRDKTSQRHLVIGHWPDSIEKD
jgi:copper oxidase (laccase) domain-containing protein